jgi:hypothetical protein
MIDPTSVVEGTMAGIAAQSVIDQLKPQTQDSIIQLLTEIRNALSPQEKNQFDFPLLLQPFPYEYVVDPNWMGKPHFDIFFPAITAIRFDVDGVGTYTKNVGPGWVQCDVRGRIYSGDANSHPVIISYRDEEIGGIFL